MPGLDLRPTADRLREALFNVLTAGNPAALENTVWFDLYAGTGAVGIEALSRGAKLVYFVESSPNVAELIRENLRLLNIQSGFQVIKMDAARALRTLETQEATADFLFLDPPYRMKEKYSETLQYLGESKILRGTSVVVVEHERRFDPGEAFAALQRFRKLEQGDAALSFYRST